MLEALLYKKIIHTHTHTTFLPLKNILFKILFFIFCLQAAIVIVYCCIKSKTFAHTHSPTHPLTRDRFLSRYLQVDARSALILVI